MNDALMAAVMGGLLVLVGLVLMSTHIRTRRGNRDLPRDDPDRVHIDRQFRRRMRTSGTISLLGVAIAIGDVLPILRKNPGLFGIYWICVLLLTVWVMLQGFGDYFSTRSYAKSALPRIRREQRELQQQLAEIKRRCSNGHPPSE